MSFRVFVINLKRRPDRLAAVRATLPARWLAVTEFTTEWPGPVDGEKIRDSADLINVGITLYDGWKLPESQNNWWNRDMKLGEIGCAYSHLSVWRRAHQAFEQDENLKYVVILEDDAYTKEDDKTAADDQVDRAVKKLEHGKKKWDLLYLGRVLQGGQKDFPVSVRQQDHNTAEMVTTTTTMEGVVRPGFSYCLYAYCLSRSGVEKILSAGFEEDLIPVDEFIPACFTMHPRTDISRLYPPILQAYSVEPYLIFQRTKLDGGSDTENSAVWKKE